MNAVMELSAPEGNLVISVKLGQSEENSNKLQINEGEDKNLFFMAGGEVYEIVKGSLKYKDLLMFQENYTSY